MTFAMHMKDEFNRGKTTKKVIIKNYMLADMEISNYCKQYYSFAL